MNKQVHKIRNRYRQNIRKIQIQNLFMQKRLQFKQIIHQDIKHQITTHLTIVKNALTNNSQANKVIQSLTELHKITCEYNIIHIMCQFVSFNPEEIQNQGKLDHSNNYTWFDLLLQTIKQETSEIQIQECSSIICNCIQQLKIIISSSLQTNSVYTQQMKRIMQNYPYQILKESSNKTIINSLQIIYFISLSGNNSNFLYYLLNKSKPSVLKILHLLYNNKQAMNVNLIRHQYLVTCLTFVSLIYYYHLQSHQAEYYDKIKQDITDLTLEQLNQSKSKQQFSIYCQFIRIIVNIQIYNPNHQQFKDIQQYITREAHQENQVYFKMLQSILYYGTQILQAKSVRIIIQTIFNVEAYKQVKGIQFRIILLKVLKGQITNNHNNMSGQDINLFKEFWGNNQSANYLVYLADAIHTYSQNHLKLLFQILSCILIEQQNPILLIEQKFHELLQYAYFRMMLQQIGYSLQAEQQL